MFRNRRGDGIVTSINTKRGGVRDKCVEKVHQVTLSFQEAG
jgi:hypothetical protein